MRLGKCPEKEFHKKKTKLINGKGLLVCKGKDLTIFCTGNILENIFEAVKKIEFEGYSVKLLSMPIMKPINPNFIKSNLSSKKVLTIEENSKIGGLSSIIQAIISKIGNKKFHFKSLALEDIVHNKIGSQNYLRDINKLSVNKIYKFLKAYINE